MKILTAVLLVLTTCLWRAPATVLSVFGNDTLVGNRSANLLLNGIFEADGGVAANNSYWATGTSLTPAMSLSSWTASGQIASYAIWEE